MNDESVYENARKHLKIVAWINFSFLILAVVEISISGINSFPYMAIFFFIEIIMFVFLFIPSFTYHLIKKGTLKYSASRALLNFAESYQYITPW